jgi:DUF4097 and DUF4098 domain-containing protein YvlB
MRYQSNERASHGARPRAGLQPPQATRRGRLGRPHAVLAVALGVALLAQGAAAAEFQRTFTFQSTEIILTDFIGAVRVETAPGSEVRVVVDVRGKDADVKRIEFQESQGSIGKLTIQFPVKEARRYVYPEMGNSRTNFSLSEGHEDRDWISQLIASAVSDRIEVRGQSWRDALELWADVTVQVPARTKATVQLGVGHIEANDVQADLNLRVRSGPVRAEGIKGTLKIDTGSGSVEVRGTQGDLHVDTGSGEVDVSDVSEAKRIVLDTGSGSVQAAKMNADDLLVDTGSGGVDLEDVQVRDLSVDTGSGGVEGARIGAESAKIDTGSGGVRLDLVRMGHGIFVLDTGSGGIRMRVPPDVSATFAVDTGSGDIDTDLQGITLSKMGHGKARFKVGNGDATVSLSTGSGSVQVTQGSSAAGR